jgi:hypothetical protein
MRLYVGAVVLVVVVLGGAWLVLAFSFGHSHAVSADAHARSATCLRRHRSLSFDPVDASRFQTPGLRALGIRWRDTRAVALFDDSLSAQTVTKREKQITARLTAQGFATAQIAARLLSQDNDALYYLNQPPSQQAQTVIGRCVYLVRYNDAAAFLGVYIDPHAEQPFLPGAHRED